MGNIINKIKIGDRVNGEKVIEIFNPYFLSWGELPYIMTDKNKYYEYEIEEILESNKE